MRVTVEVTRPPRGAVPWFARWVAASLPPGGSVLDIGAGEGLSGPLQPVRRRAGRITGVDPSLRVSHNRQLDEYHQLTLEQFAPVAPRRVRPGVLGVRARARRAPEEFASACAGCSSRAGC